MHRRCRAHRRVDGASARVRPTSNQAGGRSCTPKPASKQPHAPLTRGWRPRRPERPGSPAPPAPAPRRGRAGSGRQSRPRTAARPWCKRSAGAGREGQAGARAECGRCVRRVPSEEAHARGPCVHADGAYEGAQAQQGSAGIGSCRHTAGVNLTARCSRASSRRCRPAATSGARNRTPFLTALTCGGGDGLG